MNPIEIEESGLINGDDSVYPSLVRLSNGNLVAAFCLGGQSALGGTHWALSGDGGKNWSTGGTILAPGTDPPSRNSLRLSRSEGGTLLAYGMRAELTPGKADFGADRNRVPVLCRSFDGARTWSEPEVIPTPIDCAWEVSNPVVELSDGRWLAPAATLVYPDRLGERVVTFVSPDKGQTWPQMHIVMKDPDGVRGFFEQKIITLEPGRLLATAWTVQMGDYSDLENHFALSGDGGITWGPALPTGIRGQTLTPLWLGGNRLLVLYNRRVGQTGIQMALVRFTEDTWMIEYERMLWDARVSLSAKQGSASGTKDFGTFAFGLPSAVRLDSKTFLATYWCREGARCAVRWTRFRLCQ